MNKIFLLLLISSSITPFLVSADDPPSPPEGWTDGYVMTNGIRLHYWRTGGDKPVMVMAHGLSDDGLCWTNLARELTAKYDLILYDARGHGLSDPPTKSEPVDVQIEDLAGLIDALDLKEPVLMGHSMGSFAVAWFAARYPDIPKAVILEDPVLVGRRGGKLSPERKAARVLKRNNLTVEQLVEECMRCNPLWGLSECQIWAPSKQRHHPYTAYVNRDARPPWAEFFQTIDCPTLILKADADKELRRQNEAIASLLENGRIVHIEGAGHHVRRDQKDRVLAVLMPFLEGL